MQRWTLPLALGAVVLMAPAAVFSWAAAATSMHRTATDAQSGSAGCNRLISDPAAVKAMRPLHAEHVKDMQAWRDRYGSDPKSTEAQTALKTMRKEHVREMRAAFKELGIRIPAGACEASMMDGVDGNSMMNGAEGTDMMDGSAAGMMGGSSASGDVHEQHHAEGSDSSSGVSTMMGGSATGMMADGTF